MKQGSTDDPFAEEPKSPTEAEPTDPNGSDQQTEETTDVEQRRPETARSEHDETSRDGAQSSSRTLPYIYKRDAVKEDRSQRPVYLREYNESRIPDLVDAVETELGEDVTKTDVLEAAMETAIENPEQVSEILRTDRYGYDWE